MNTSSHQRRRAFARQLTGAPAGAPSTVNTLPIPAAAAPAAIGAALAAALVRGAVSNDAPATPDASGAPPRARRAGTAPDDVGTAGAGAVADGAPAASSGHEASEHEAPGEDDLDDHNRRLLLDMGIDPDDLGDWSDDDANDASPSYGAEDDGFGDDPHEGGDDDLSETELEEMLRDQQKDALLDGDELFSGDVRLEPEVEALGESAPEAVAIDIEDETGTGADHPAASGTDDALDALAARIDLDAMRQRLQGAEPAVPAHASATPAPPSVVAPAARSGDGKAPDAPTKRGDPAPAPQPLTLAAAGGARRRRLPPSAAPAEDPAADEPSPSPAADPAPPAPPAEPADAAGDVAANGDAGGAGTVLASFTAALADSLAATAGDSAVHTLDTLTDLGLPKRTRPRDTINRVLLPWLRGTTVDGWTLTWQTEEKRLLCTRASVRAGNAQAPIQMPAARPAAPASPEATTHAVEAVEGEAPAAASTAATQPPVAAPQTAGGGADAHPAGHVRHTAAGGHREATPVSGSTPRDGDAGIADGGDGERQEPRASRVPAVVPADEERPSAAAASDTLLPARPHPLLDAEAAKQLVGKLLADAIAAQGISLERQIETGTQRMIAEVQLEFRRQAVAASSPGDAGVAEEGEDLAVGERGGDPSPLPSGVGATLTAPVPLFRRGDRMAPALLVLGAGVAIALAMPIAAWTTALLTPLATVLVLALSRRDDHGAVSVGLAASVILALLYNAERARAQHLEATLDVIARALGGS